MMIPVNYSPPALINSAAPINIQVLDSSPAANANALYSGSYGANDFGNIVNKNVTLRYSQLESMYRGSWIIGMAVDCVAEDMTREGIDINDDIPPEDIEKIQQELDSLNIWESLCETEKWARLYGGAIAFMMIDGQDPSTPLNIETIGIGQFKGLMVFDRTMVVPSQNDLITEYGADIGKPKFYQIAHQVGMPLSGINIHHSRVIRSIGIDLPIRQSVEQQYWGGSIVERIYDRVLAFDSTTRGAAQLVHKAHLRVFGVKNLNEVIVAGGSIYDALMTRMGQIGMLQRNEGITLKDVEETFETHQYSFGGISDILLQNGQQISGALGIPLVRLFGQSPAGFNSTGEADIRLYYDKVKQQQERKLRPGIAKLIDIIYRSVLGRPHAETMSWVFNALWQMSDTEKATNFNTIATGLNTLFTSGIISQKTVLMEVKDSSQTTGIGAKITDEEIAEAENNPPALGESILSLMTNPSEQTQQENVQEATV